MLYFPVFTGPSKIASILCYHRMCVDGCWDGIGEGDVRLWEGSYLGSAVGMRFKSASGFSLV
jgi:hypothetical protein